MQSALARRYSVEQLLLAHRAGEQDVRSSPCSAIRSLDRGRVLVLLADDGGLERDAAAAEDGAGVDEDVEALLGDVAADGEDAEVAVARRRRVRVSRSSRAKSALTPW